MKVLVVGATGPTGRELLKQATAAGHEVTALVRDASKLVDQADVRLVVGDVLEPSTLGPAVAGQEAVLSALGGNKAAPPDIRAQGTSNIIAAMEQHEVKRLVALSAFGAGDSKGQGGLMYAKVIAPLFLKKILADQTAMEAAVRSSGLEWTLVRATRLNDKPAGGKPEVIFEGGSMSSTVSRADTAAFMVGELADRTYVGKAPGLTA